ncbi:MAG: hypothetical protein D3906_09215 [Candidatus Electrothrix sp. AUS1_2]|nr:hypothetical protein [Candidatus Electrothrix sp. AUS1_2]
MSARKNEIKNETARSSGKENGGKIDPAALAQLTGHVRYLIAFHQEIGLSTYPAAQKLRQFLTRVQRPQPFSFAGEHREYTAEAHQARSVQSMQHPGYRFERPTHSPPPPAQKNTTPLPPRPAAEDIQQELTALNREILQCRQCTQCASGHETEKVLGRGNPVPRLLVLGDYCGRNAAGRQLLWGEEEDAMLWRMMAAIGLEQDAVYVTNAVKCAQPAPAQANSAVDPSCLSCCLSHIEKELQIVRPKLICAMGDIATRAVLKNKAPLARVRGIFHPYQYPQGDTAKVMPTFHPRLLLQYPEMKQATWKDLQVVQKALEASSRRI